MRRASSRSRRPRSRTASALRPRMPATTSRIRIASARTCRRRCPGRTRPPAPRAALLMFDREGRPPGGVSHWVAYGIPVSVTGFAEGEVSQQTEKYVGGKSLMGLPHYFGPCTPPGAPHHYTFTLIATDLEPNALQPGLTR